MLQAVRLNRKNLHSFLKNGRFDEKLHAYLQTSPFNRCAYDETYQFFWTAPDRNTVKKSKLLFQDIFISAQTLSALHKLGRCEADGHTDETPDKIAAENEKSLVFSALQQDLIKLLRADLIKKTVKTAGQNEQALRSAYGKENFLLLKLIFKPLPYIELNAANYSELQNPLLQSHEILLELNDGDIVQAADTCEPCAGTYEPCANGARFVLPTKIALFYGEIENNELIYLNLYPWTSCNQRRQPASASNNTSQATTLADPSAKHQKSGERSLCRLELAVAEYRLGEIIFLNKLLPLFPACRRSGETLLLEIDNWQEAADFFRAAALNSYPLAADIINKIYRELTAYVAGTLAEFTIPCRLQGSAFQVACWRSLLQIPYGTTCSYSDLAKIMLRNVAEKEAVTSDDSADAYSNGNTPAPGVAPGVVPGADKFADANSDDITDGRNLDNSDNTGSGNSQARHATLNGRNLANLNDINIRAHKLARAVGQTMAKNPLPLLFPCHRVIGADQKLTGYSHGLKCKAALLAHELAHLNSKKDG